MLLDDTLDAAFAISRINGTLGVPVVVDKRQLSITVQVAGILCNGGPVI